MKIPLLAVAVLALAAGAASAQPPTPGSLRGPGPGHGPGGFGLLQFDANADGKLTKAEFDAALRTRFDKIDANKDGAATREELQLARAAEMEAERAERTKERFTQLDKDRNGQLSQAEFAAGMPAMGKHDTRGDVGPRSENAGMRGSPPPLMAGRGPRGRAADGQPGPAGRPGPADTNADTKLTFDEFSKGPAQAFARADINKDGTVTIAEIQSLRGGPR